MIPYVHVYRVGDILESVNGQSMANAVHREAVRAVKESKGSLTVVRHCYTMMYIQRVLHHYYNRP